MGHDPMPHLTVDGDEVLAVSRELLTTLGDLENMSKDTAYAACILTALFCLRGPTTLEQDVAVLQELTIWLAANDTTAES